MVRKDIIRMRQEELRRLHIIKKAKDKEIKQQEASELIGLSIRQVRRLIKRVKEEGDKGITHKLRGKRSNRRIQDEIRDKVIEIYKGKYNGFGPTLAAEKFLEHEQIKVSQETLRKWLIQEDIRYPRRKKRPHRQWRQRKDHFGQMVQIDGSHHDWFEGRGPKCVFMGYIDDATGRVFGRFYEYEGTIPAMDSFKGYIDKYGIPLSVYVDRHTTYKSTGKPTIEDELNGTEPMSEFERSLKELGVEVIYAYSPQAKGRIERLFKTLQDRLIKEMRLRGIKSIEEANRFLEEYLPLYNEKFSIIPMGKQDMHREVTQGLNLDNIFCIKTQRVLRNDFTVSYKNRLYQIEDNIRAKKVVMQDRLDGALFITYQGRALKYKEIHIKVKQAKKEYKGAYLFRRKKKYYPSVDHPWKKPVINPYLMKSKQRENEHIMTNS